MRILQKIGFYFSISALIGIIACSDNKEETKVKVDANDLASWVNPFIGTGGLVKAEPGFHIPYDSIRNRPDIYAFGGLVFPGATVPFGMIQLSPDCNNRELGWSAGYHYSDSTIQGFSLMHTSGNGNSLGHFLFLPLTLDPDTMINPAAYLSSEIRDKFSHKEEVASPGFYSVMLNRSNIKAELTTTVHTGIQRYSYPLQKNACLVIDLIHAIGDWQNVSSTGLVIISDTLLSAYRTTKNGITTYISVKFSSPVKSCMLLADGKIEKSMRKIEGKQVKALLSFGDLKSPLVIKTGLSSTSQENAGINIAQEANHWNFDVYRKDARNSWNKELSKIIITEGKAEDISKFYTALYHSFLTPFEFDDANGDMLCADKKVRKTRGRKNYTFFTLWDTYRALNPLHTILQPERVNDIMQSMVVQAEYSPDHLLPMWCLATKNSPNMAGHSGAVALAEAIRKGYENFETGKALSYLKSNLETNLFEGYKQFHELGYIPCDSISASVPRTLEYAFCDWNVGELCSLLGDADSSKYFDYSKNYKEQFDKATGFFRPRFRIGDWKSPYDPRAVSHHRPQDDYMESNAWQHNWHVMHDVAGMISLMGGKEKFIIKLDSLFDQPSYLTGTYASDVSGLVGQYAQGNQPSHHVAYLYALAGEPSKTQKRVREVMEKTYHNAPDGLPGNDDGGEMSAWYVFSSLGFYPVNPASGEYVIGTPGFSKMSLAVSADRDKVFTIYAINLTEKNIYIQKASLNGKPYNSVLISHSDIMKGGKLVFDMGPKPSSWAELVK